MKFQIRQVLLITVIVTTVSAAVYAQLDEHEEGALSTKPVISPELSEIATKLFENYQSLSNVSFHYTLDADAKYEFEGSYLSRGGKARLERNDLTTPYEVTYSSGQTNDQPPIHRVHVFDGIRHHQLSIPDNRLVIKDSAGVTAPFGHVWHPIQAQYGWHVFPGVDGFGVRVRDGNAWKERFSDAKVLGEDVVNGWNTIVVAIRSFPTLPLDLNGRHKRLYLAKERNFTPVKYTVEGEQIHLNVTVLKLHEAKIGTKPVFVPLVVESTSADHLCRFRVDRSSIVVEPVVDESTFVLMPPANVEVYDEQEARAKTIEEQRFRGEQDLGRAYERIQLDAKLRGKHVLVFVGNSAAQPSHSLSLSFHDSFVLDQNRYRYEQLRVDVVSGEDARVFLDRLGVNFKKEDAPCLLALDEKGDLLGQLKGSVLADITKVDEFLEKHSPEPRNATDLLNSALAEARATNKCVLLQETGFACRPCYLLSKFFHSHWKYFQNDYILVKINSAHDIDGHEVISRFQSRSSGIPWLAVLDKEGNVLMTSDSPDGNIGFPQGPQAVDHFLKMLKDTAKQMNDNDLDELRDLLTQG